MVELGKSYAFVRPAYVPGSNQIASYTPESGGSSLSPSSVSCLGLDFIRSQFYYYRGERVSGGIFSMKKTPAGLAGSEKYLKRAEQLCPKNPLAVYMLWRVYLAQGNKAAAAKQALKAYALYKQYGYFPGGSKDLIAAVGKSK